MATDTKERESTNQDLLYLAINQISDHVVITDVGGNICFVNDAFERMTGYSREEAIGATPRILKSNKNPQSLYEKMWKTLQMGQQYQGEIINRKSNGEIYYDAKSISPIKNEDGRTVGYMSIGRDISKKRLFNKITGLPNREHLLNHLDDAMASGERKTLLYFDIDKFKTVNDRFGYDAGNKVMVDIAERLKELVKSCSHRSDIYHVSSNTFAVVVSNLSDQVLAARFANMLMEELFIGLSVSGVKLMVTACVGISTIECSATSSLDVLRDAESAMYSAKEHGPGHIEVFDPDMRLIVSARSELEGDLRLALQRNELSVAYQPIVDAETGEITSCEALARWNHPERGAISPEYFIPIAEANGLIAQLGEYVLGTACAQLREWHQEGHHALKVSVNLSPLQFEDENIIQHITDIVKESGISTTSLKLEITEDSTAQDPKGAMVRIHELKQLGIEILLDDFGTGYSNLGYLSEMPLDKLKIDRSFVVDICKDQSSVSVCAAIISLAHTLGLSVIAEGVEELDQLEKLRSMGCEEIQGYYFSKPVNAEEFGKLLASNVVTQ